MNLVLLILLVGTGVHSQCIFLQCNPSPTTTSCNTCYDCMGKTFNFCFTGGSLKCGCVSDTAKSCKRVKALNSGDITACKLHGVLSNGLGAFGKRARSWKLSPAELSGSGLDQATTEEPMRVPKPIVRAQGNTSLSVIVDRFFSRSPFDVLHPSRLMLLADFTTKDEVHCKGLPSVKSMKWTKNHCVLRIHLAIPGVDHPSDDQYYYDDQSPLETEFSTDLFEQAELVRFWVEVNTERSLELAQELVRFSSAIRSEATEYKPHQHPLPSSSSPAPPATNVSSNL
ncbi:hypothetical protein GCK32_000529 [Trichostrongylus colubriformis]|uniref:Uncharacterized protein n=1 Tax=Trichostrongylus colubriformis TaxID=6319 RepID=A0AAN8FL05_TRICO